jgi:fluoride exporter
MGSGAEAVGAPGPKSGGVSTGAPFGDASVEPRTKRRRWAERPVMAAVALGGALGAPARYGISLAVHVTPGTFPWGTFWTNVSGSFVLGLVLTFLLERFPPSRFLRPFVATGFLGAFTTYSTFAVETDLLVRNGHVGVAAAYALGSLAAGFTAVWVGIVLARAVPERRRHSQ